VSGVTRGVTVGSPVTRAIKRAVDIAGASVGIAVSAPVMAVSALAIRSLLGSPVLFRQTRAGLHGEPFELVKFRSMRPAPAGLSPTEAHASDAARLTGFGKFLRSSSIDELPSLWNVLRGDMSLVGPRPLLLEYLARYTPEQATRHDVRPGVTGWAQVNGRNSRPWDEKLAYDSWYVANWSLGLDVRILFRTIAKVLRREGIHAEGHVTMPQFRAGDVMSATGTARVSRRA
jgi:sugar transferase EpsL